MGMQHHDGFDGAHASTGQNVSTYLSRMGYSGSYSSAASQTGRTGTGLAISNAGPVQSLSSGLATVIAGLGVRVSALSAITLLAFNDGVVAQLTVMVTATGAVQIRRGNSGGTVLAETAGGVIAAATWVYLELKATINATTGSYEVRVNGSAVLTGTGANTDANASSQADSVQFGSANGNLQIDDVYAIDTTGSVNNDFLGPVQSLFKPAAADSATNTGWTPSTGSDHFATVDERPANDDTDYNSAASTALVDTYDCGDIGGSDVVLCVTPKVLARKTDAGVAQLKNTVRVNGTNYDGDTAALADTYTYIEHHFETSPDTGIAWTAAEVNASELAGMTSA